MDWHTEYPRPLLRRDSFFCLNGSWQVNGQQVNVPYPPQSTRSGWQGDVPERLHYERAFTLPESFSEPNQRVILHLGAVDQVADVYVNGRHAAHHEGGYLPFQADVTNLLHAGENTLAVDAVDTLDPVYPRGKQSKKPGGMWYTPVSGVWQTVWMEAVPAVGAISSLRILPDLTGFSLRVEADAPSAMVQVEGRMHVINTGRDVRIDVEQPHLWTPEDPYLYEMTITTGTDRVHTYAALRTVDIREINGHGRICLNGKPIFLNAVLDQGYFPDGIFLPESPDDYDADILRMKKLGFNMLRKHIKIEPERFYYACDRLGMLVMQDMVSSGGYNFLLDTALPTIGLIRRPDCFPGQEKRKAFFRQHCLDTVNHLYNHPCIVAYTIFNEGWGQFHADDLYRLLKKADPSRVWDATSGWFIQHDSDVDSVHMYFRNKKLKGGKRPLLLSECGGYARPVAEHLFKPDAKYGYGAADTEAALTDRIISLYDEMVLPSIPEGLCGVVYTQVSDVEEEINGLYTYDRQVCKVDEKRLREVLTLANKALQAATE